MSLPIRIKLPEHFLKEEMRCGYQVSEKLKKIWAVELDLLDQILSICKKHKINVQLGFGSLLGAVRHKGFIPWDDDLDVWMSRAEYIRFCDAVKSELEYPYFFQTAETDRDYFIPYGRLRNSETTAAITGYDEVTYNNGIYVDVYVLDGLVDSPGLFLRQKRRRQFYDLLLRILARRVAFTGNAMDLLACLLRIFRPIVLLFGFDKIYKRYVGQISRYNSTADRISPIFSSVYSKRFYLSNDEYLNTEWIDFEGFLKVPIPRLYDGVLSRLYGKYMEFPPVEERGKWHEGIVRFEPEIPYEAYLGDR